LELLDVDWACAKIGAVVVPLSPLTRGKGLVTLLNDSDSALVVADSAFTEHLDSVLPELHVPADRYLLTDSPNPPPGYRDYHALTSAASDADPHGIEIAGDDPYNIMYTSGTTGLPKGIVLTQQVRAMYGALFGTAWRMTPESVVMHAGSLVFNGAFLTFMPAFYYGATYVLQRHFDADEMIKIVERERVTHIFMVPSQIVSLLNAKTFSAEALKSLEMIGSVGAPLHKEHKEELVQRLPGVLYELYGLTEGFMTILDKNHVPAKMTSVGVPPPFFEMRIVNEDGQDVTTGEVGEIIGRSPVLMAGYYKRPDLTAKAIIDGWLYTGDLGYVDQDGFLFLVDRAKDLIISGGVNVYPRDIEEIIVQHPAVREAAVFGIPDDKWGETPLAAVILKQQGATTPDELKDWINERVEARFQRVSQVVFMDDFPRSTAGKTLKRVMREPYWAGRETRI
jgi:acyl-CoA synthetase (AMP-forming)/AMP-acid ligase II